MIIIQNKTCELFYINKLVYVTMKFYFFIHMYIHIKIKRKKNIFVYKIQSYYKRKVINIKILVIFFF